MRHIKLKERTAFLMIVLVTTCLTSCIGADEVSANNSMSSDSSKICEADSCKYTETPLYRRGFFVCGFELAYGEPLPTINPLEISENIQNGSIIGEGLEVNWAEGDSFRGFSPKLDCHNPSLEKVSLVEVFEMGPDGQVGEPFPDKKLDGLELISTDHPWRACVVDTYLKPFSEGLAPQAFVLARHRKFDSSNGIRCSAAAHLTLAGIDISEGVENHMELRGPLKNRFRFVTINDRN